MSRQPGMPCLVLILLLFCTASVSGFAIGVRKDDTTTLLEPGRTCADHSGFKLVRAACIIAIKLLPRPCPSVSPLPLLPPPLFGSQLPPHSPLQFSIPARGFKTHAKRGDGCWFELSLSFASVFAVQMGICPTGTKCASANSKVPKGGKACVMEDSGRLPALRRGDVCAGRSNGVFQREYNAPSE